MHSTDVCPSVGGFSHDQEPSKNRRTDRVTVSGGKLALAKGITVSGGDVHWRHLTNTNGVVGGGCDAASQYYYSSNLSDLATLTEGNENPMGVSPLMLHETNDRAAYCVQWLSVNQSLKYCKCET